MNEIVADISPMIRVYKDGRVERMIRSPFAPPSPQDQTTGVSSKDLKISEEVSARLYLPADIRDSNHEKLPIIVYYHAGAFCIGSAFCLSPDSYLNLLVAEARALVVSVEYRLAPEHPLPTAFDDSWTALQWVASHADNNNKSGSNKETWLINYGNFDKLYVSGDSSGANIAHNIAMRAGEECLNGDVKILGALLCHPYFLGSDCHDSSRWEYDFYSKLWKLAYPSAPGGIDNPMINPLADNAPSLCRLGCSRLLVTVAEMDFLKRKAILYVEAVKKSEWKGEVKLIEIQGEEHNFYNRNPNTENAKIHIKSLASFLAS